MREIKTPEQFNSLVASNKPIVLDFYAGWCGPCQTLLPIMEELSEEYAEKIKIVKVNVDENKELAEHFEVRSIPTLFFIQGDEVKSRIQGLQTKSALKIELDSFSKN